MERDFPFTYEDDEGKIKRAKADLAVFDPERSHDTENTIRIAVVSDSKVKDKDPKKGVARTLGNYLEGTDCEFGVWTNGNDLHYLQCEKDDWGQAQAIDISDFPGKGQSMQDLELSGERAHPRKPANDSLVKTFRRCHDYIYGNEGMKKTAYETIVSNTLKQEAGQFFTPRNVIRCMVEIMDPDENTRVLDPACGSGGFLVIVLDHVRKKIAGNMYPELTTENKKIFLEAKYNSYEVNNAVKKYAERMLFGFDFDLDLKKAARIVPTIF
ncbi:MAG: SAM-dependent methyltransferase [Tannerellaceae bacterium]|jgi:hypothetical protein|nr:SAM-dependent methyltransferase [Tannerellaceae bacterium]